MISPRDFLFKVLMGGAYTCPQTNKAVPSWTTEDDDKFICDACGKTHTKALCKAVTFEEAEKAGFFEQPKIKKGAAAWHQRLSKTKGEKHNGT